jgi:hypothetical protein
VGEIISIVDRIIIGRLNMRNRAVNPIRSSVVGKCDVGAVPK